MRQETLTNNLPPGSLRAKPSQTRCQYFNFLVIQKLRVGLLPVFDYVGWNSGRC